MSNSWDIAQGRSGETNAMYTIRLCTMLGTTAASTSGCVSHSHITKKLSVSMCQICRVKCRLLTRTLLHCSTMVYLHLINEVRGLASHGIPPNGTQLIVASLGAESECYSRVTLPAKAVILEHKISLARHPSDAKVILLAQRSSGWLVSSPGPRYGFPR